jgi:ATP-dependent exoDNAse (exonuclease V) beta subunit
VAPEAATLSDWLNEYKSLCRYERLRPYAIKMCPPKDTIEVVTMAHRQLYRFRYHRPKTILMLEEFKNRNLAPLKEYLDNISSETPHQYFQDGERMSEIRSKFDKADMVVRSKTNFANRLADFVLQSVPENKQRHEELQRFMIANDSCTVATEVPVYIRREDVEHLENILKFKILDEDGLIEIKGDKNLRKMPKLLTGHIDFIQIRNGQVHLLDYKPNASKEKPIEQLTWYALAMSRLTGLRIFNFVCAWFDEKDYYQFYPLHVVKKISYNKKRKIYYKSGEVVVVPKENILTIT